MNFYELCVSMGLYSDMKEENLMNWVREMGWYKGGHNVDGSA